MAEATLDALLAEIGGCRRCAPHLPHEPRPVLRASPTARVVIIGQAPGNRVHQTGIPWNDPSGQRLRSWLKVDEARFYDRRLFALVPMGFCFPGHDAKGGDLPPRKECAPLWHERLLEHLPEDRLCLLVGQYAQRHYLGDHWAGSLTETVRRWRECPSGLLPLPHPSWRNTGWLRRHPWFESDVLPVLQARVHDRLTPRPGDDDGNGPGHRGRPDQKQAITR